MTADAYSKICRNVVKRPNNAAMTVCRRSAKMATGKMKPLAMLLPDARPATASAKKSPSATEHRHNAVLQGFHRTALTANGMISLPATMATTALRLTDIVIPVISPNVPPKDAAPPTDCLWSAKISSG